MPDYQTELYASYARHSALTDPPIEVRLPWFREYASRNYLPHLKDVSRAKSTVLEVGCNKGYLLKVLSEAGFTRLFGVDLAESELLDARELVPNAALSCADAQGYLASAREKFDVIIMKAVLEHVEKTDVIPLLSDVAAGLREGGIALIDVPNMDWLFAPHERYMDFTHEVGFTKESLRQVCEVAFQSVQVYPLDSSMPGPAGRLKQSIGRAVLGTAIKWADAEGGSGPIWQRSLLAVGRR